MGPVKKLTGEVQKQRVRVQAAECRRAGMDDAARDEVFASVVALAEFLGDEDDPSDTYQRNWLSGRLSAAMPALDPATIILLVQLAWLIYQALKALGYLNRRQLASLSTAAINEHFGGL